jgi:hypothetical protein
MAKIIAQQIKSQRAMGRSAAVGLWDAGIGGF